MDTQSLILRSVDTGEVNVVDAYNQMKAEAEKFGSTVSKEFTEALVARGLDLKSVDVVLPEPIEIKIDPALEVAESPDGPVDDSPVQDFEIKVDPSIEEDFFPPEGISEFEGETATAEEMEKLGANGFDASPENITEGQIIDDSNFEMPVEELIKEVPQV